MKQERSVSSHRTSKEPNLCVRTYNNEHLVRDASAAYHVLRRRLSTTKIQLAGVASSGRNVVDVENSERGSE